jgi:CBS domain-containing protein
MLTAKDIMTSTVITVTPEVSVKELAALLLANKIGGAPVVDADRKLLGVVTESDLIDQKKNLHLPTLISIFDSFLYLENPNKADQELKKMMGRTVADIYVKGGVSVQEDTPLSDIATIMSEKKIHTLPVVSGGTLVGVIGKSDLIRAISNNV